MRITCVKVRSSPGLREKDNGSETAACLPPLQVLTTCVRLEATGLRWAFLRTVCTTTSELVARGAIWMLWMSGLSQKISETLSYMPGVHLIFSKSDPVG